MSRAPSSPPEIYRPLIPMAVAVMAGITCGIWMPGCIAWVVVGVLLSIPGLAMHLIRRHRTLVLPLVYCVMAGYLSIQPWVSPRLPDNHVSRFADQGIWQIHGKVIGQPHAKLRRWRWVLAATRLTRPGKTLKVCGRVKVSGRGDLGRLSRGDRIIFDGRLRTIRNFANPGGFDYQRFMSFQTIRTRSYARAKSIQIQTADGAGHWLKTVDDLRCRLARQMDTSLVRHSPEAIALLKVLLLGDRRQITERLRNQFNRAGVGHVLAISGLHVGMVATMAFVLARWVLSLVPLMLKYAWTRKGAALFSLAAVAAYGVLAGLSPSTQRAMIMVAVFLARYWVGRQHDWLNSLALAALIILIVHPPSLLSISFQLSFTAVLALIMGLDALSIASPSPEAGLLKRCKARLAAMIGVSAMAIIGTLPLVVHYFNQSSTVGLLTNLLVVPAVASLVVPAGLIGVAMASFSPEAGVLCWQLAAWTMEGVYRLVEQVAQWPWSAVKIVTPNTFEIILYYLSAALFFFRNRIPGYAIALALMVALWAVDGGYWYYQRFGRHELRVTALDVGQGSANLLQLPGGGVALVDGGGFSDNRQFDVGARIIAPLLWRNKIKTVDLVVLTHPNSDHLNGLLYILEHFNVRTVWSNGEPAETQGFKSWTRLLAGKHIDRPRFEHLPAQADIQGVHFEILSPPKDFSSMSVSQPWRDANNNSLVLRVGYQGVSILFSGDIATSAEAELLTRHRGQRLCSTILMAPHHGSGKSSTMAFLKAVNPMETVISCGWENRFGFPHPHVVNRLKAIGSRVWNTAEHGAVQILIDGEGYLIRTWR